VNLSLSNLANFLKTDLKNVLCNAWRIVVGL
jgi:hypothetical protein